MEDIHDYYEWDEQCSDRFNQLTEEGWFQIYDSGFGQGQTYVKLVIKKMDERFKRGDSFEDILNDVKKEWEVK